MIHDLFDAISRFPRAPLLSGSTPIDHLPRLSAKLGIHLDVKRDDLTGLGMGGNKVRQLEFYFGAALEAKADTILITGAVQSNYVRTAAAAAAKLGMTAVVQLEERVADMGDIYHRSGNVMLNYLLGARVMYYPKGEDEAGADAALRAEATALTAVGRSPYVIPLALDNPPLGALGYVVAAQEIAGQMPAYDAIVVGSGSGQTHAGLLAGLRALGVVTPVHGSCVRRAAPLQREQITTVCRKFEQMLGLAPFIENGDVLVWDGALEPGYGRIGTLTREALDAAAQMEGLFVDPVYTAKTLGGVVGLVREGEIKPGSRVLFVHTGGTPALFGYQSELVA